MCALRAMGEAHTFRKAAHCDRREHTLTNEVSITFIIALTFCVCVASSAFNIEKKNGWWRNMLFVCALAAGQGLMYWLGSLLGGTFMYKFESYAKIIVVIICFMITFRMMMDAGIEVYNTSTRYIGKEYNMAIWDELLDEGWNCPALAVDDIHNLQHIFGGWTMILADDAKPETLLDALRKGSFYATQGPEFSCIEVKDGILHAEFSEVVYAVAVGRFGTGKYAVMPDTPFHGDRLTCTSMSIPLDQIKKRDFVRIQIRDANGNYAWSNPIPGNAQ